MMSHHERVCRCSFEGCKILTRAEKEQLFSEYYKLNYIEQSALLSGCMELGPVKRRRVAADDQNNEPRRPSFIYMLHLNGKRIQICQKTLCDIYCVSHKRIQNLQKKMKAGGTTPVDRRGQHKNRPQHIADEMHELVQENIKSFPVLENHYSHMKMSSDVKY